MPVPCELIKKLYWQGIVGNWNLFQNKFLIIVTNRHNNNNNNINNNTHEYDFIINKAFNEPQTKLFAILNVRNTATLWICNIKLMHVATLYNNNSKKKKKCYCYCYCYYYCYCCSRCCRINWQPLHNWMNFDACLAACLIKLISFVA